FDNLFAGIYSKTDVVVEGASIVSDEDRPSFPEDVLDRVRAVDGVRAAAGGVEGTDQLIKPDGDAVSTGGGPAQGFSWDTEEAVNALEIVEGRAPSAPGEMMMEKATAENHDF